MFVPTAEEAKILKTLQPKRARRKSEAVIAYMAKREAVLNKARRDMAILDQAVDDLREAQIQAKKATRQGIQEILEKKKEIANMTKAELSLGLNQRRRDVITKRINKDVADGLLDESKAAAKINKIMNKIALRAETKRTMRGKFRERYSEHYGKLFKKTPLTEAELLSRKEQNRQKAKERARSRKFETFKSLQTEIPNVIFPSPYPRKQVVLKPRQKSYVKYAKLINPNLK